jgi:proteasome lid subunit RPN8/RPN11
MEGRDHKHEEAAVLIGHRRDDIWHGRLRQRWTGGASSVAFDWSWVLEREERYGDVIGFYHTHPAGLATPSQRDVRTMRAWVSCLGKPLLCLIGCADRLTATLFESDLDDGQPVSQVACFPRRFVVVVL